MFVQIELNQAPTIETCLDGLLIKLNQVRKCKEVWNTDGNGHAAGRTDDGQTKTKETVL